MIIPLLLLAQVQAPLAARADTLHPRNDAIHHDVTLVIGDTGNHIVAITQTTWVLRSQDPVQVQLDSAFRVVRVLTDGEGEHRMGRISYALLPSGGVYIPHHRQAGDTLRTSIRYHGPVREGLVIRTDSTGRRTVFADNWPDRAHHWIPLEDHPSDKATIDFHVEVGPGVRVIANGVLLKIDTLPRGRTVWHYSMAQRIPAYGMVIGAGPLTSTALPDAACDIKCVPLAVLSYAGDSAWAVNEPFRQAGDMLGFFSRLIGPFPYDRLSHVQSTTIFGGVENPTAIFYDGAAYPSHRLSPVTVAHETAHQWFGDAVTEDDWHHLWLSEGFATYFSALWVQHAQGDSAFHEQMQRAARAVMQSKATERPILDMAATDLMGLLNSNNYPKGAWVLHSLRGLIGDSAFAAGIREYYRTFRDSTALSADFARIMGQAAGRDLEWYFRQALTQPGYPKLAVRWQYQGKRLTLTVRQTQPDAWGRFALPGLVFRVDGRPVHATVEGAETVIRLDDVKQRPREIVVDPDGWWLLESTVEEGA
jgi:aminopeptidase N